MRIKKPIPVRALSKPFHGFSLVELMAVMVIVATMFSLATPSIMHTRETALHAVCLSNLREIAIGDTLYRNSHNQWIVTQGLYPAPSPSAGSNNLVRPNEPAEYEEYWSRSIRWCPSLKRATGYLNSNATVTPVFPPPTAPVAAAAAAPSASASAPVIPTGYNWWPIDYSKYTTFGYVRPAYSQYVGMHYPTSRLAYETNYPNSRAWATFVKLDYTGYSPYTWAGQRYRPEGTRPIAADMILTVTTYTHVTAHNGLIGKTNGNWPGDPQSGNAVWIDGSATSQKFPGRARCYNDGREVETGVATTPLPGAVPDEAYAADNFSTKYFIPVRRSR